MSTEASPRPWAHRPLPYDDWGMIRSAEEGNRWVVARAFEGGAVISEAEKDAHRRAGTDPYESNAALIVRAVNTHDGLLAALKASLGYLRNASIDLQTGAPKATALRTIEGGIALVETALAKAGETP